MKFEIGKSYQTRLATDADSFLTIRVVSRTAKTVRIDATGFIPQNAQFRIKNINGIEAIEPWGSYSMSPLVTAEREAA